MSLSLIVLFACVGTIAVLAIASSLERHLPLIAALRATLARSPDTIELLVRVENQGLVPALSSHRRKRRAPRPKPVRHRLHRRAHRATA